MLSTKLPSCQPDYKTQRRHRWDSQRTHAWTMKSQRSRRRCRYCERSAKRCSASPLSGAIDLTAQGSALPRAVLPFLGCVDVRQTTADTDIGARTWARVRSAALAQKRTGTLPSQGYRTNSTCGDGRPRSEFHARSVRPNAKREPIGARCRT